MLINNQLLQIIMFAKLQLCLAFLLLLTGCSTWSSSSNSNISHGKTTSSQTSNNTVSGSQTRIHENNVEDFYVVFGKRYAVMKSAIGFEETGIASWYGDPFHGQKTSNGEVYDMYQMTAAHKHLPLPTFVEVTHLGNGRKIIVRVNDRGPFKGERVIDLSYAAAKSLDMINAGTARVSIRALDNVNSSTEVQNQRTIAQPIFVQTGSFSDLNNAVNAQDVLLSINIQNSQILHVVNNSNKELYRLQIGPISTGKAYDSLIAKLKKIGITETVIVRIKP